MASEATPTRRRGLAGVVFGGTIWALFFAAIFLGIGYLISLVWPNAAMVTYGIVILFAVLAYIGFLAYLSESKGSDLNKKEKANRVLYDDRNGLSPAASRRPFRACGEAREALARCPGRCRRDVCQAE
jgi:hypothetical protein